MMFKALFSSSSPAVPRVDPVGTVISSHALREAALRASWHRDRQVARRREAWRWVVFWSWKYGRKPAVVLAVLALVLWASVQWLPRSLTAQWAQQQVTLPKPALSALQAASSSAQAIQTAPSGKPATLEPAAALTHPGSPSDADTSAAALAPLTNALSRPIQLKPEFELSPVPVPASIASRSSPSFPSHKGPSP
jgi:hypothetical protein